MKDKPTDNGALPPLDRYSLGVHDKDPQEVLGAINKTDLPRNIVWATIVAFAFLAVLTVGPYFYNLAFAKSDKSAEKTAVPESAPAAKTAPTKETSKDVAKTNPDPLEKTLPDPLATKTPKGLDPLEKLGVSETKTTDPKKNPLDKSVDDLLKDIK